MARVHKNYREGKAAIFTNNSKFTENINTHTFARDALIEGDILRKKISGKRILVDTTSRELKNAFRL